MNELLSKLELRFKSNMHRHENILWEDISTRLLGSKTLLTKVSNMEDTLGEPDVIKYLDNLYFVDFSKESPLSRRSFCYDELALNLRKTNKPKSSVESQINKLGIDLLTEDMYLYMQSLEDFDLKTSSWIFTPSEIRNLGGALNAEKRYNRAFIFHNGADSYYASRGFRGFIKL